MLLGSNTQQHVSHLKREEQENDRERPKKTGTHLVTVTFHSSMSRPQATWYCDVKSQGLGQPHLCDPASCSSHNLDLGFAVLSDVPSLGRLLTFLASLTSQGLHCGFSFIIIL